MVLPASGDISNSQHTGTVRTSPDPKQIDSKPQFNPRNLWPDIIKCPENEWTFEYTEIMNKLGTDEAKVQLTKKKMEKCLMYFHKLRKEMKLFDHTYTAACILFYRYWYKYDLPPTIPQCIHLAQAILVTACKTMENNRPTEHYIKATCEFMVKDGPSPAGQKLNLEKLKWEVRDQLVSYEKKVLCQLGFDLSIENPKELIEEIFSGYYRHVRDTDIDASFKECLPALLQEARNFIIQTGTQPISLLCDGYTLVVVALIFAGVTFQKVKEPNFKFPHNFFKKRFPVVTTSARIASLFSQYQILERTFFDLKSNKGTALSITASEIDKIIDEDDQSGSKPFNPYDYEHIKEGEVNEELLEYTERKIEELSNRIMSEKSVKRTIEPVSEQILKKQRI
ncbi:unnamed protein product [Kluyveromyces dobzhanskii CBS 2104]|uniref:WGS project CCBQ000000000 data, contig 00010 n=1 Tax=Kluyveromyces dobzhanskii CBS 2104 TaxID=1427455 RepID=A0A0A8LAQ4_9SACH|nr:unnamed protein product [Kluyveromyces dobzhanskii CBS 2104]